jgi:hypothetical protein
VNEDQAKSCIKILNGSMWKGSRLRLEIAHEFYQDKLNLERLSAVETISGEEKRLVPIVSVDPTPVVPVLPSFSRDTIVLKHGTREYEISIKPTLYSPSMKGRDGISNSSHYQSSVVDNKGPRAVIPCGMKRLFNDDDHDDDEANLLRGICYLAPEASQLNQKRDHLAINGSRVGSLASNLNYHGGKLDEELPLAKKAKSTAPIGGGVRKGFGSLLSAEVHKGTKDVACCIDKTVDNVSKDRGVARTDGGMSSDDDEPCVRQEDLDDAALTAERNRALSILRDLFTNDDASSDDKDRIDATSHHDPPPSSIDRHHSDAILLSKDGYANVDQLKSIFHREGGVWWGDDGTMKQAVRRGEAALDPMFLEAEKRGIELRPHRAPSAADADVSDGVSDKLLSDGQGDGKSMVFSFFAAEPIDHDVQLHVGNHKQHGGDNCDQKGTNSSSVLHTNIAVDMVATQQQQQQKENTETVVLHWTLSELIQMAKSFSRSKSIEQVTEDWKVEREKLKIDYKRKMRDVSCDKFSCLLCHVML